MQDLLPVIVGREMTRSILANRFTGRPSSSPACNCGVIHARTGVVADVDCNGIAQTGTQIQSYDFHVSHRSDAGPEHNWGDYGCTISNTELVSAMREAADRLEHSAAGYGVTKIGPLAAIHLRERAADIEARG